METRKRNISLESILVMILLVIFAISSSIMIVQGSQSYNHIIKDKESAENARIALSYINMRVKQNDVAGKIRVETNQVEGQEALIIEHSGEEEGYQTAIFWMDGSLWECYTDQATKPTKALSSEIVQLDALNFYFDETKNVINVTIEFQYGKEIMSLDSKITLRTSF